MLINTDALIGVVPARHPYANLAEQLLALDPVQPRRRTQSIKALIARYSTSISIITQYATCRIRDARFHIGTQ